MNANEIQVLLAIATVVLGLYCYVRYLVYRYDKNLMKTCDGDMVGRNSIKRDDKMGTVTINGQTFTGNSISMIGNKIVVDGKDVTDQFGSGVSGIVEVRVLEGTIENLTSSASVSCGNVTGNVDAGGSISCGNVGGSVDAGGSVRCGSVGGSVDAGGSVRHG